MFARPIAAIFAILVLPVLSTPAQAAKCGGDYNAFIAEFLARGGRQGHLASG